MNPVPVLNSRVYDFLKYLAQIVLPAFGALYFATAQIWGFPNAAEVVGTITVFDAFLGGILNLSSKAYDDSGAKYDGAVNVSETNLKKTFSLDLDTHPDELEGKDSITLKVNKAKPAKKTARKPRKAPARSR